MSLGSLHRTFLKYVYMKSGFRDFKVLKASIAILRKRLASTVGRPAFNSKLLQLL